MTKLVIKTQSFRHFIDLTSVVAHLTRHHKKNIHLFFSPEQLEYYKNVPKPNRIYGFEFSSDRTDKTLVEIAEEIIRVFGDDMGFTVIDLPPEVTSYCLLNIPYREHLITNLDLRPI